MGKLGKVLSIIVFALTLFFSFTACGDAKNKDDDTTTPPQCYTLTLNRIGQGSTNGGGGFESGTTVTITATPSSEYVFDGWYDGETQLSSLCAYTFNMPNNSLTLTAKFVASKYTLLLDNIGQGSTSGAGNFEAGACVTVTATPNTTNYLFDGWYQDETKVSTSYTYTFYMPSNSLTLTAKFVPDPDFRYTLTVTATGGGSIRGDVTLSSQQTIATTTLREGDSVTLTAMRVDNNVFVGWFQGDTLITTHPIITYIMPFGSVTITARFTE